MLLYSNVQDFTFLREHEKWYYNEGQKCWDTSVKWPLFEQWTYLSPSPSYLHPSPPKSMLYFGPSSLSFTSDNIDSGGEGIYGV